MKCDEFDERVHSLLDDRVPVHGDQRLLDHADACSRCRGTLRTYDDLFVGLKCDETQELGSDFTQRVVAQVCVRQTQTVRSTRHARRWFALVAMAIAAGLLIALFPFLQSRLINSESIEPQVVEDNRNEQSVPLAPDPTKDESSHDDAAQLATVDGQSDEKVDAGQFPGFLGKIPPDLPYDRFVPVDQIRGGLRPITSSLAVAINALRSTIPIGRHDQIEESSSNSPSARFAPPGCISV